MCKCNVALGSVPGASAVCRRGPCKSRWRERWVRVGWALNPWLENLKEFPIILKNQL